MKHVYPIIISKSGDDFVVSVPDLDINTQGTSIPDAIDMAREAIGLWAMCREDLGEPVPEAKSLKPDCSPDDVVALVDIDFAKFRQIEENRAVRKNCTIPAWLNDAAENANINFSAVLQQALKRELNLEV